VDSGDIINIFVILYKRYIMAKIKEASGKKLVKVKVSRPGVHAKTKTSKLKSSKNYKKSYKAQGR